MEKGYVSIDHVGEGTIQMLTLTRTGPYQYQESRLLDLEGCLILTRLHSPPVLTFSPKHDKRCVAKRAFINYERGGGWVI